jgi:hypothetical protein
MSTYDDGLLAARFAALAPEPLASNWGDVLDRAGARTDRRRLAHPRAHRRRRLLIVLAAVALVAVATASAFAVRAFVLDKGLVGLPPVGATPSTPESGVREMFFWVHHSANWVYADGRLIRHGARGANGTLLRANRWSNGIVEQRLTREGVKLLRSEIVSAGGFGDAQPPPGSDPLFNRAIIEVRKGDQLVHLRWARDLERLESRLAHPESWLPASAWKQRTIRAYVPSRFKVCAAVLVKDNPPGAKFPQMRAARIVALLPQAAQNALRGRDWTADPPGPTSTGYYPRCFDVATAGARSLAKALDGAGPAKKGRLDYIFNAPDPNRQVLIGFNPYLPHGKTYCLGCG